MKKLILFTFIFILSISLVSSQNYPNLRNFVTDDANIIDDVSEAQLNSLAQQIEQTTTVELAIVTVDSLENLDIETYAVELFEKAGIGKKDIDTKLQWTGIPTSIGIAKTKTLSKIANHIAKKQKSGIVNLIGIENIDSILEKIKVNDIWGVGRQTSKFYIKHGINNAKQLKNISNNWIKNNSNVLASRTAMELRGISCIDLETYQAKRKSCCVSRSFGEKVENFQILVESIASHSLNAAEKIRSESLLAKAITIFIRTSLFQNKKIFYSNSKTIDFPIATDNSIEIVKNALEGLKSIFKKGYRYQKAGIILSGLLDSKKTHNLFSSSKEKRIKSLMKSIDYTNYRYGRSTLSLAGAGLNKKRNIRRKYFSKIDTANFDCLPIVKVN